MPQDATFGSLDPIVDVASMLPITDFFVRTHLNGLGAVLNIHGEGDSDQVTLNLAGEGSALVNVFDNGAFNEGADTLIVNGDDTPDPGAQPDDIDDTFLLRSNYLVLLNESVPGSGTFDLVERVNYDKNINARLIVNGLGGNDKMVADDNSSITTIDGGEGNDVFQIGQVFGLDRTTGVGLEPGDTFDTTPIVIGVISHPVSGDVIFDPTSFDPTTDTLDQAIINAINDAIALAGNAALDGVAYVSDGREQGHNGIRWQWRGRL